MNDSCKTNLGLKSSTIISLQYFSETAKLLQVQGLKTPSHLYSLYLDI